ncbi:ABC transporter permease [Herbiconiux sp. VKM Ac-1786]|uniref:ABC transporter permease n=1 Tax=Herbiconiux sp. VKM Ac-1786 TaxID=2783824 RepID=UPI00188CAF20|nr:FtsX-like permease family protein [Herbiconiux sp. VKM Ac-1786]MBF4573134.1 ABC transporter permease [Herbiconiux sp. VKM Ac-1786]
MRLWALRELRETAGRYAAGVAVVAVVAAFAVLLLETIEVFVRMLATTDMGDAAPVRAALTSVGLVFLGIAVLTAAIVISGTFATVYAGRRRDIALLRLVGATSAQVRRASRIDGLAVGLAGAVAGIAAGILISLGAIGILNASLGIGLEFAWTPQLVVVPLVVCVAVSALAASSGAKVVARVSPAEGARSDGGGTQLPAAVARGRGIAGVVLFVVGGAILALGLIAGLVSPFGLLIAFPGGVLSIVGVILGASALTAPIVAAVTRLLRGRGEYLLAGANLRANAVRTARTIVSVLIGVTLVTMFTVAGEMYLAQTRAYFGDAVEFEAVAQFITVMLVVVYVLTAFSVLVAAIGLGSNLSLSVLQRQREIAVLRSVGLTSGQAQRMVLVESVVVAGIGAVLGLALGVLYGFVGANSTFGSQGFSGPVLSPWFVVAVLGGAVAFSVLASLLPGRRAARVHPAEALRDA